MREFQVSPKGDKPEDKEAALVRSWKEVITPGRQSSMCLRTGSTQCLEKEAVCRRHVSCRLSTARGGIYI